MYIARKILERLDARIGTFVARGNYKRALDTAARAVRLNRRCFGEDDPHTVRALSVHAAMGMALGEFDGAIELLERLLPLFERGYGAAHLETAQHLGRLATAYWASGRLDESLALCERAHEVFEQTPGAEPLTAQSFSHLAALNMQSAKFEEAERQLVRAIHIFERLAGPLSFATGLPVNNLALLHYEQGDFDLAEPLLARACTIFDRAVGARSPISLTVRNNQARLYMQQGRYEKAQALHEHVLAEREKTLGPRHRDTMQSVLNLAAVYLSQGRFADGDLLLRRAIATYEETLGSDAIELGMSLSNLGHSYWRQDRYGEAEPLLTRALALFERVLGEQHTLVANVTNLLANVHAEEGRHQNAGTLYERALAISEATVGPHHHDTASQLVNLAIHCRQTGERLDAAQQMHLRAIDILERTVGRHHPTLSLAHAVHAHLLEKLGRPEEAFAAMIEASAGQTNILLARLAATSETGGTLAVQEPLGRLYQFLSLVMRSFARSPAHVAAAFSVVLQRKAVVVDAALAQRTALLGTRYPDLRPQLAEATALRRGLLRKTLDGPVERESLTQHQETLREWQTRLEQLESKLARQIPELELNEALLHVDAERVAAALPVDAALIEFVHFPVFLPDARVSEGEAEWGGIRYAAFIATSGKSSPSFHFVDLGDGEEIDSLVTELRQRIVGTAADPPADPGPDGARLYTILVEPLLACIGTATHLFVCPDGGLNLLPFETLPVPGCGYLLDRIGISYLGSGRDVLRLRARTQLKPAAAVVVSDPAFDLTATGPPSRSAASGSPTGHAHAATHRLMRNVSFPDLPGTRFEGLSVARHLGVAPLSGGDVLKGRIKALESPRILHIATHGFFFGAGEARPPEKADSLMSAPARIDALALHDNPMLRSGLLLAGARTWLNGGTPPADAEDGLLTAEDISTMDLRGSELAVLSACNTALGEVRSGEGVVGLRRAFVVAGAKTLVMSLWEVDDLATLILMDRFYGNLLERGLSRSQSLREAQRYLREELTVALLRTEWLTNARIESVAAQDDSVRTHCETWLQWCNASRDDTDVPFHESLYWAGFVLVGDPGPLVEHTSVRHAVSKDGNSSEEADAAVAAAIAGLPARTRALLSVLSLLSAGPISYSVLERSADILVKLPEVAEELVQAPRRLWIRHRMQGWRARRAGVALTLCTHKAVIRQAVEDLAAAGLIDFTDNAVRVRTDVRRIESRMRELPSRSLLKFAGALVERHVKSEPVSVADYEEAMRLGAEVGTQCVRSATHDVRILGGRLLLETGKRQFMRGEFQEAERLSRRAMECRAEVFGWHNVVTGQAMHQLAWVLNASGQYGESAVYFERAVETYAKAFVFAVLLPQHFEILKDRGVVLIEAGRYLEAEDLYSSGLKVLAVTGRRRSQKAAQCSSDLARTLMELGRYEQAEECIRRSLSIYERRAATALPIAGCSSFLASLLVTRGGDIDEAEMLARRALLFHEQTHMLFRVHAAAALVSLARVLKAKNDLEGARERYEHALRVTEGVVGPENTVRSMCLMDLALLLRACGRAAEAESLCAPVVNTLRERRGRHHPLTGVALRQYGTVLAGIPGRSAEAEQRCREGLAVCERSLGREHISTAHANHALGEILADSRRHDVARAFFEAALAVRERVLGTGHRQTLDSRERLQSAICSIDVTS